MRWLQHAPGWQAAVLEAAVASLPPCGKTDCENKPAPGAPTSMSSLREEALPPFPCSGADGQAARQQRSLLLLAQRRLPPRQPHLNLPSCPSAPLALPGRETPKGDSQKDRPLPAAHSPPPPARSPSPHYITESDRFQRDSPAAHLQLLLRLLQLALPRPLQDILLSYNPNCHHCSPAAPSPPPPVRSHPPPLPRR